MKQIEVAKQLGISKSYLSMILSGQREVPEHLKKPISELFTKTSFRNRLLSSRSWVRIPPGTPDFKAKFPVPPSSLLPYLLNSSHTVLP